MQSDRAATSQLRNGESQRTCSSTRLRLGAFGFRAPSLCEDHFLERKRPINTPDHEVVSVLKSGDDVKSELLAPNRRTMRKFGGRSPTCKQWYAAERVLSMSRFELRVRIASSYTDLI